MTTIFRNMINIAARGNQKCSTVSPVLHLGQSIQVEDAGIDLLVCDEAHKLKNDEAATTKCISALPAKRRLLISGTPIQNSALVPIRIDGIPKVFCGLISISTVDLI